MNNWKYIYLGVLIIILSGNFAMAQSKSAFRLPVEIEDDAYTSSSYVIADYTKLKDQPLLKDYTGNENDIRALSDIISSINNDNLSKYKKVSSPSDSTIEESFGFYRIFIPLSENPKLHSTVKVGNHQLYFVKLDEGIPPIIFCLQKDGNTYLNNPVLLDQTATTALTSAITMNYVMPEEFGITGKFPASNFVISFDSIGGMPARPTKFLFDTTHVYFNVLDIADTGNYYPPRYKAILEHYRKTLRLLSKDDLEGYYTMFSDESRSRLEKSFAMSNNSKEALEYYREYKTSYSLVTNIIDLNKVQVLLVTNPEHDYVKTVLTVYMLQEDNNVKWINENKVFYLDDLFRTHEFQRMLVPIEEEEEE